MTDQPSTPVATTAAPVECTPANTAAAEGVLSQWLKVTEGMGSERKDAFRSQVSGMLDALKLVVQQKFNFDTHVAKIEVTEGDQTYLVYFHYQIPLVKPADRRPKPDASAKLSGIVKDPSVTKSAPMSAMLAIHMYIAGQATNRSVQLQADVPGLIKYYERFGYTIDEGQQSAQKPLMTATQDEMSLSTAATSQ